MTRRDVAKSELAIFVKEVHVSCGTLSDEICILARQRFTLLDVQVHLYLPSGIRDNKLGKPQATVRPGSGAESLAPPEDRRIQEVPQHDYGHAAQVS